MNFAIVEDIKKEADLLKSLIEKYCARHYIDCCLAVYHTEREIRSSFKPGLFDIIFLDVYLDQEREQGVSLGTEFMSVDKNLKIVFCTVSPEYAAAGFQINATHYILKPATEENVSAALSRLSAVMERDARYVTVSVKRRKTDIFLKDIVCAEVYRNQTIIHTADGEALSVNQTLGSVEEELRTVGEGVSDCFNRCHKCFLVNMHHVTGIDEYGDFVMSTDKRVLVRVKNGKTAKRQLHDFLTGLARAVDG